MQPDERLLCLRANAPQFDPAKGADGLPQRMLVLGWGEHATTQGKVIVDDATMRQLADYNRAKNWDRIAVDFEHSSVPGSPTYKGEPVKVAGYGKLELVPNEGIYLLMSSWTPEGKEFAAGGHYGDLSPVVKCNEKDEVIGLHSVALCRHGATPGLVFLSATAPGKSEATPPSATHPSNTMKPEDFQKALAKALGLPDTASAEDILAALTAKLEAKDAATDKAESGDMKALSASLAEIKGLLKQQSDTIKAQDERIKLLSSGVDNSERATILREAAAAGKQVPPSAAKNLGVADLKLLCAELPVTVPVNLRTPDASTLLLSTTTTLPANPELAAIDKLTGVSDEDAKKYKVN
ncbi:phage protease [Prosthecobacter sp.]|uniref:phage protease n=1 Tax=Prosthecobacter sp. TaxID=1965333 RepID=UPI0037844B5D